jgi:hypothetical protein
LPRLGEIEDRRLDLGSRADRPVAVVAILAVAAVVAVLAVAAAVAVGRAVGAAGRTADRVLAFHARGVAVLAARGGLALLVLASAARHQQCRNRADQQHPDDAAHDGWNAPRDRWI